MCNGYIDFYIRKAILVAMSSTHKTHKHGCVIIGKKSGRIISTGYNFGTVHAEENAILKVKDPKVLKNCILLVVRINSKFPFEKDTKLSKPCCKCQKIINASRVGELYYSI
jgi:deoxycytidylate deaminase